MSVFKNAAEDFAADTVERVEKREGRKLSDEEIEEISEDANTSSSKRSGWSNDRNLDLLIGDGRRVYGSRQRMTLAKRASATPTVSALAPSLRSATRQSSKSNAEAL